MKKEMTLETLLTGEKVDLKNLSFEQGLKLLEALVGKVEEGSLPLDSAMSAYEKGVQLVDCLQKQLSGAEEKLKVLRRKGGKGRTERSTTRKNIDALPGFLQAPDEKT